MYWNFFNTLVAICAFALFTIDTANAYITDKTLYYGKDLLGQVQSGQLQNEELLEELFRIVQDAHIKTPGGHDQIIANCLATKLEKGQKCIQHAALGYDRARKIMFGSMYLEKLPDGTYAVKDVYCEKYFTNSNFGGPGNIGPGLIPSNGSILNTEHTWPQSRFTGRFNTEMQKSDLHHLYPTDSQMNSYRSSLRFGEVSQDMEKLKCPQNRLGRSTSEKSTVFEPPVAHRGNVARSIFYFSVRYQMKVSGAEQEALKRWHKEDPVDADEQKHNDMIEDAQGNRNPFVDYPELVDRIGSFTFSTVKN